MHAKKTMTKKIASVQSTASSHGLLFSKQRPVGHLQHWYAQQKFALGGLWDA